MGLKKIISGMLIMALLILQFSSFVIAADEDGTNETLKTTITPEAMNVQPGEEFSVTASINYLGELVALTGKINFDTEMLELKSVESNTWTLQEDGKQFINDDYEFVIDKKSEGTSSELFTMKFKAIKEGIASISLTNVTASAGNGVETSTVNEGAAITIREVPLGVEFKENCNYEKYKVSDNEQYIRKIPQGTTIADFMNQINYSSQAEVLFVDNTTTVENTETKLKTGMDLVMAKGSEIKSYTIVVEGDVDGNGIVNINDLVLVKVNFLDLNEKFNLPKLTGAKELAAELDYDDNFTINDIAKVKLAIINN